MTITDGKYFHPDQPENGQCTECGRDGVPVVAHIYGTSVCAACSPTSHHPDPIPAGWRRRMWAACIITADEGLGVIDGNGFEAIPGMENAAADRIERLLTGTGPVLDR